MAAVRIVSISFNHPTIWFQLGMLWDAKVITYKHPIFARPDIWAYTSALDPLGEFDFRYNNRKVTDKERGLESIKGFADKCLNTGLIHAR